MVGIRNCDLNWRLSFAFFDKTLFKSGVGDFFLVTWLDSVGCSSFDAKHWNLVYGKSMPVNQWIVDMNGI